MTRMWARKLGIVGGEEKIVNELAARLLHLMSESEADWTMTWRQLAMTVEVYAAGGRDLEAKDQAERNELLEPLRDCFYSGSAAKNPMVGDAMRKPQRS